VCLCVCKTWLGIKYFFYAANIISAFPRTFYRIIKNAFMVRERSPPDCDVCILNMMGSSDVEFLVSSLVH